MAKPEPSLLSLLKGLTTSQGWKVAGAIVAILTGTFSLGFYVSGITNKSALNTANEDLTALRLKQEQTLGKLATVESELDGLRTAAEAQNKFLSDYQRYLIAHYNEATYPSPENAQIVKASKKILTDRVRSIWEQQGWLSNGTITLTKGLNPTDSRVVIMNSASNAPQSIWVLPPEVKEVVLSGTSGQ